MSQEQLTQADPMDIDEEGDEKVPKAHAAVADQSKRNAPHLPISKLKKIARSDPDYIITSSNAFVATAFATELFVQSLTEEMLALSHLSNKSANTKSLRLTYNHLSECVSRKENFQFLEDVIPKTKNLRTLVKENKIRYTTTPQQASERGQSMLPFTKLEEPNRDTNIGTEMDEQNEEEEEEEGDDDDEEEGDEEEDEVQEQLKEIEQINHVADLDDGTHSNESQTDQEDE